MRDQLVSEHVDERWIGPKPRANYAWHEGQTAPMEEARKRWDM